MEYLSELFNLKGKNVVIIGGGGHICGSLAMGFAKAGCNIVILDIRKEKAIKIENLIKKTENVNIFCYKFNATRVKDYENVIIKLKKKFNKIDILINGAGINSSTPFIDITESEWTKVLDSQINATFYGCQYFGKEMIKHKNGSIINISSASAGPPLSRAFAYSVAKAGIKNLTQNLGREWGKHGVRVNAIRPGFFPTEWNLKNFIDDKRKEDIWRHTPMGRFGTPEELIGAVLWLSSDAAKFVTGSELTVDGGFSCMTI